MISTLAKDREDLQIAVGEYAGMGDEVDNWPASSLRRINRATDDGVLMVYRADGVYEWSWLKPITSLTLTSGESTVKLPDDFNWMSDNVIPASASGEAQFRIPVIGEGQITQMESLASTTTGRPQAICVQAIKGTSAFGGSKKQLKVFPTADQDYTLQVPYSIIPNALTAQNPHVYGCAMHSLTFKYACIAAYEIGYDKAGERMALYQQELMASINMDRKNYPTNYGGNYDRSDDMVFGPIRPFAPATFNGVTPGIA